MLRPDDNSVIWEVATSPSRLWIAGLLATLLVVAPRCVAQDTTPAAQLDVTGQPDAAPEDQPQGAARIKPAPAVPRVQGPLPPAGPDTYLLLDSEGRPQPILGMTYEEFVEAWKKVRELDDAAAEPAFVLKSLAVNGRVEGDAAVLDARLEIELRSAGPIEVPLGFAGAILRELDQTSASLPLSYDEQRGGYLAWLRDAAPRTITVNLPLLVPLKREGDRISLRTNVPRALVNQLVLDTPQRSLSPVVSEGALVQLADRGDGSRMSVTGIVGDLVLSWQSSNSEATQLGTVLSVQGLISTSVDGRGARSDARLRIESFGGKFQQFRLRLPPGAQLIAQGPMEQPADQPAFKLIPASGTSTLPTTDNKRIGQLYEVRFAEPTAGPVDVQLTTEQAIGLSPDDALTELAGFEVPGAVRQFGEWTVRVDPDWQFRWSRLTGGRQISADELSEVPADEQGLFAFEYYQQPWSLPVEVRQRDTRVAVAPKYRLEIMPEEVRLRVTLQYQLAGSKETKFWVDLAGWHITSDPIEPTRMINADQTREINADQLLFRPEDILQDAVRPDAAKNTLLELTLNQPASRRTEITFQLRRPLEDLTRKPLPLPMPLADSIGTGELIVLSDPSLLVTPNSVQADGLAARPLTSEVEATSEAGLTQIAAYRSFLDRLAFSADVKVRPGEVKATIDSTINLDSQRTQVEHVLSFDAKYQPLTELELLVPAALWRDPLLRLTLLPGDGEASAGRVTEGVPLDLHNSATSESFELPAELITVTLPQPRLGRFRLRASYSVPSGIDRTGSLDPLVIPLIVPSQAPVVLQTAAITGRGLDQLELIPRQEEELWSAATAEEQESNAQVRLKSAEPTTELALLFRPQQIAPEGRTVVDHVWLQTWMMNSTQQRVVYRLRSNDRQLTVELPPRSAGQDVEVVLDNQPVLEFERLEARLVVPLPESSAPIPHTLELRYLEPDGLAPWDELSVDLPQVGGDTQLAEFSWMVVVPRNCWIIQGPSSLAPAFNWRWSLAGLAPVSFRSSQDLETANQARQRRQPGAGESEYLYTGIGPGERLTVYTIRSEVLLLAIAVGTLGAGLALVFMPILRLPSFLLAAAVALVFVAAAYPELALIAGPPLALGGALALLGGLLYLLVPRRQSIETTPTPSTFLGKQPSSKVQHVAGPVGAVSTNAPTVSLSHIESY